MIRFFSFFIVISILYACNSNNKVSNVQVDTDFVRFDSLYCNVLDSNFTALRQQFEPYFNPSVSDTIFIQKKNHPSYQRLCQELQSIAEMYDIKSDLIDVLKYLKYYSGVELDSVVFLNSDFDHKTPVLLVERTLMLASDMYIGEQHQVYRARSLPDYLVRTYNTSHVASKVAKHLVSKLVVPKLSRLPTFVDKMIWHGKQMYFARQLVPHVADSLFWETEAKKVKFVNQNMRTIWNFWIEKNMLYSKSSDLDRRFLDLAPFSKFYANIDRLTPSGIGKIIGFKIVESYVEHNGVSDEELLDFLNTEIPALQFLQQSNFKPY